LGQKQTTRSNSQSEHDESPWTGMDSQHTSYNDEKSKHANLATTIPSTNQPSTNTDSCESTRETTATLTTHENNQIGEKLVNMKVLDRKCTNLNILSFNVEGFNSNKLYLELLSKRSDIILMQEHWLHSRETSKISHGFKDFLNHTKCFDDEELPEPSERKRGHAGVSIMYRKELELYMSTLPDGRNRIVFIKLNFAQPIILVCVYLPTRGNGHTRDEYQAVLDELSEIIAKYNENADILIGGDLNASCHRTSSVQRDSDFKNFMEEHALALPGNCKNINTFYHYNGRDHSQIDYFIQSTNLVEKYITFVREPCNTSTHDPIMVMLSVTWDKKDNSDFISTNSRVKWDKLDKTLYEENLCEKLLSYTMYMYGKPRCQ